MGLRPLIRFAAGPPKALLLAFRDRYRASLFVECGTYKGKTARWAASHFEQVITIEAAPPLHRRAKAGSGNKQNIQFLLGDTRAHLPSIVDKLHAPAVFWLDSHWSGGATWREGGECPLLEECELINRSSHEHLILVDDARLFLSPPPPPHDPAAWPDIAALLPVLRGPRDRKVVLVDDVLVAAPRGWTESLIQLLRK